MRIIFLFVISCFIFVACKTSKKVVDPTAVDSPLVPLYEENKLVYDNLEMTSSMQYDDGNMSLGFNGIFRIKHEEKIWGSLKKFGFEAARVLITPDSLFVINRFQKSYIAEDIKSLKAKIGLEMEFSDLEQLLLGGPFMTGSYIQNSDSTIFMTKQMNDETILAVHTFSKPDQFVRNSTVNIDSQNVTLDVVLDAYRKIDLASVPHERYYLVNQDGNKASLNMATESINLNTNKTFPFEIPSNYSRTSL